MFRSLDRTQLKTIAELQLGQVSRRLHGQDIAMHVSRDAIEWLASTGYEPEFGARPLRIAVGPREQ